MSTYHCLFLSPPLWHHEGISEVLFWPAMWWWQRDGVAQEASAMWSITWPCGVQMFCTNLIPMINLAIVG